MWKAVVSTSYCGGLRGIEVRSIMKKNVNVDEQGIWVQYMQAKQKGEEKENRFLIPFGKSFCFASHVLRYLELRQSSGLPEDYPLFVRACKNGLGQQPMGENKLGEICKTIANELGLPNSHTYTGHCMRRSAGTEAASKGATSVQMKGHFGWQQEATALKYIDVTRERPTKVAELLTGEKVAPIAAVEPSIQQARDSSKVPASLGSINGRESASMAELAAKFEAALTLTSAGCSSKKTSTGPLALALGALGSMGTPVTVSLAATNGDKMSIQVNGSNLQISNS